MALSLLATACGRSGEADGTTTVGSTSLGDVSPNSTITPPLGDATTSTVGAATTTTLLDDRAVSPLNGMPVDDPTLLDRKLIAVKIDNSTNAQPQSGIEEADAIIELVLKSDATRFIALFLESDTEWLGPMRSIRPTDSTVIAPLNGVLQMSGGQSWIRTRATTDGVALIGEVGGPVTMRWNGRNAPHNLYVNTAEVRNHAEDRGLDQAPPPPLFEWSPLGESARTATGDILFDWTSRVQVTWQWAGTEYLRFVSDNPHNWRTMDGEVEEQVAADTLIVLKVEQYVACPSGAGSCVPASVTVGENGAMVFAGGRYVEGKWQRDSIDDWFILTTDDGETISVPAGRIFIMLYPDTAEITW